ncbi:GHKL domain-containing protein [Candidatus Poribacteria bacterium]|nr:GHKL domain-containing protein [Candidatus Poribacteria bacterium]
MVIKNQIPLIRCDRQRINQVFDNLLDNANKFIGEGNTDPTVEIGYEIQDGYHKFHVKDNGIGIQKEYHEKVFQVFQRLDQKTGGTGVGLTIVKKIIEGFEGKIWLDSDKGKGTTVYFTIPRDISAD